MRSEVMNDGINIIDGVCYATPTTGETVLFDEDKLEIFLRQKWSYKRTWNGDFRYVMNGSGVAFHRFLLKAPPNCEIDHINMNTLDNRLENLRVCTHQQNQCNQGLQKNNTSGVSGVSFYPPRHKYRARIKATQHDIHLGYFETFTEAVQARNVGMECMFGEYGRYNDVPPAPEWIRKIVIEKCMRFAELAPKLRDFETVA